MAQAVFAVSIKSATPHRWMIDADLRRLIDWERSMIMDLADGYFDYAPGTIRKVLWNRLPELDYILDRLPSGAAYERIADVQARVIGLTETLAQLSPDALADGLMTIVSLMITGSDYADGDMPAEFASSAA